MKYRIWAALLTVYLVWGSTYLAIRFAVETMPPFLMAAARFLLAGAVLYAWRRSAGDPAPTPRQWRSAVIVGLFLLLGGNGAVVWAEQRVPSGIAALVVGSSPLWMVALDALRPDGKRPNLQTAIGVLVGFIGIAILVGPAELTGGLVTFDGWGMAALLLAAFLWAVGSLYGRDAEVSPSPLQNTGMQMLGGGAGLLVMATLTGEWGRLDLAAISAQSWLGFAYLVVFGALLGFVAYSWLLRAAPTPLVATYAYVNPLIAIFLGNLLAKELLTPRILLAAGIILSAVAVINTAKQPVPKAAPA